MSETVIVAIIVAVPGTIAALVSAASLAVSLRNSQKITIVAGEVNGKLTHLIAETSRAERAEGRREGIEAAVVEQAARKLVTDPEAHVVEPLPLGPAPPKLPGEDAK